MKNDKRCRRHRQPFEFLACSKITIGAYAAIPLSRAPAASGNGNAQPARASTIPSDSNDDGKPDYT